jgi:hypothetical protein
MANLAASRVRATIPTGQTTGLAERHELLWAALRQAPFSCIRENATLPTLHIVLQGLVTEHSVAERQLPDVAVEPI